MKRKIRKGVWETNSSSCHSVSISKNKIMNFALPGLDEDGFLIAHFDEFGWEINRYNNPTSKLSYALTMVAMIHNEEFFNEVEFYELDDFKMIEDVVKNKIPDCEGIQMAEHSFDNEFWGIDGYIDHQSYECYSCLQDFLNDYDITLEDFIFNANVILQTDNDNH